MGFGADGPAGHFGSVDQPGQGASGPWPGFGVGTLDVAATSGDGVSGLAARVDHFHKGVHSVNGLFGDVTVSGVQTLDGIQTGAAKLSTLASANFTSGALAYVVTVGDFFRLQQSALTVDNITVVTATGKAGYQWVRLATPSPSWALQVAWVIDPANSSGLASDENSGADATHPLLTYSEHVRRLGSASVTVTMAITVLPGSQQAADKAIYSCVATGTGSITFTGTLTSIFSGTVTTYTAGAAAPSTDDGYTIVDATIPVSWTASGLLADGVLFKRTNGTAAYWWVAKDLGGAAPAARARISVPVTATGRTAIALANGDTYQAFTMPTVLFVRFTQAQGALVNQNIVFNQFNFVGMVERAANNIEHVNCFETGVLYVGTVFANSAFKGSINYWPMGPSPVNAYFGLMRSGSAIVITAGPVTQWTGRLVIQNGTIHPNGGCDLQFAGDIGMYDVAANGLIADYWSIVLFQSTGCIAGNNNAGSAVVWANKFSQIAFLAASIGAAGTFTGGTPIAVGGTSFSTAAIDAGTGNQLATKGNGIYHSD